MDQFFAEWALLEGGFVRHVGIGVVNGVIASVTRDAQPDGTTPVADVMLPGMPDLHSHGFQRVFAGTTNWTGGGSDFWSWREAMYRAVATMTPELYTPVFAWLCKELLKGGYTCLAEFHYLQHLPDASRYTPETAMADALIAGAAIAGMPLTMLVGVYETGGFEAEPLAGGQLRFKTSAEDGLRIAGALQAHARDDLVIGLAPHSLRAVPPNSLSYAVKGFRAISDGPIHIHVAEQTAEVQACTRVLGAPPVAWLLNHAPVDASWCLIHATHATVEELAAVAQRGAVIGLCPSTEADLGDGIFAFPDSLRVGNSFGIGTDSNTALDAFGELRLLEYAQRLQGRRRNVAGTPACHTGRSLWQAACSGGARACGRKSGRIAPGFRADFTVIAATEETEGAAADFILDAAIFSSARRVVRDVMTGGRWVVRDGMHVDEAAIDLGYREALRMMREAG